MDNELYPAVEVCKRCSISYRTLIRWVERGIFPRKYLCRRDGRIYITADGYKELKMLGRLRKHLPIRNLRRFINHFREKKESPKDGQFAVLKGPNGEQKVLWETQSGKMVDSVTSSYLQLPLFNFYSLEDIVDE